MELSDRKKRILKAIIEDYIEYAEPVGSKTLLQKWNTPLSSATIRNEMSELEEMGLLEKPHTSAGRVPSHKGYRTYVNELMHSYQLTLREVEDLNETLRQKMSQLDKIISESGKIISELTNHPAITITPRINSVIIRRFEFVMVDELSYVLIIVTQAGLVRNHLVRLSEPVGADSAAALTRLFNTFLSGAVMDEAAREKTLLLRQMAGPAVPLAEKMTEFLETTIAELYDSEVFLEGASRLLNYPEFQDTERAKELLDFLSDRHKMSHIPLSELGNAIGIAIGRETSAEPLRDASVVYTTYTLPGGLTGVVAVVGPTRMNYAKNAARLDALSKGIHRMIENMLPEDNPKKET